MVAQVRFALLLPALLVVACTGSGGRTRIDVGGHGQACNADTDCSAHSCLSTTFGGVCTEPCQDSNDCRNNTVCGVRADGSRSCLPNCSIPFDPGYTCINGVTTACAFAGPAGCSDCGCPSGMRCTPGVGCGPLAKAGEPCTVDADCNTDNCSAIFHLCRAPVGQPCTADNCDVCLTVPASGWSYCSRDCDASTNCNGGHCTGDADASDYTCHPPCADSSPACAGGCTQITGTQTSICTCSGCSIVEPKRILGTPCRRASQCVDGECLGPTTPACDKETGCGTCSKSCTADADCGAGLACAQVACAAGQTAGCGNKCLRTCEPGGFCSVGTCRSLAGATGSPVSVCDTRG